MKKNKPINTIIKNNRIYSALQYIKKIKQFKKKMERKKNIYNNHSVI